MDKGQYEAGYASGLTKAQTFFHVIVPQAVRAVIPPLTNDILSLVKGTALVSVIGPGQRRRQRHRTAIDQPGLHGLLHIKRRVGVGRGRAVPV